MLRALIVCCLVFPAASYAADPVTYPDHSNVLVVRDDQGHERPVKTRGRSGGSACPYSCEHPTE